MFWRGGLVCLPAVVAALLVEPHPSPDPRYPERIVFLEGTDAALFMHGFPGVKLTPHEAAALGLPDSYSVPAEAALRAIEAGRAVVYRFDGGDFTDTTADYGARLAASPVAAPSRLETANIMYEYLLGSGWQEPHESYRWIGKSATATLGGASAGTHLHVRGFCAPIQLAGGPLQLSVRTDADAEPARFTIDSCGASFDAAVPIPPVLLGQARFLVTLEVDRADSVPPEPREVGLAIEALEIR